MSFIAHARRINALVASGKITSEQGRHRVTQYLSGGLLAKLPEAPKADKPRTAEIASAISETLASFDTFGTERETHTFSLVARFKARQLANRPTMRF